MKQATPTDTSSLEWLTLRDVGIVLRVSAETVRNLILKGKLSAATVNVGDRKHYRVHRNVIAAYLSESQAATTQEHNAAVKVIRKFNAAPMSFV